MLFILELNGFYGNGEREMSNEQNKDTNTGVTTLRSKFCDSDERTLVSPAQQAATRECQYPQQPRVQQHEPFEPYGMN